MKIRKAIKLLRFERRRMYAKAKISEPYMAREYRERAEAIGAALGEIKRLRRRETRNEEKF